MVIRFRDWLNGYEGTHHVPLDEAYSWLMKKATPSEKRNEVMDELNEAAKEGTHYIPDQCYDDEYYDDVCYDPDKCQYCGTNCC